MPLPPPGLGCGHAAQRWQVCFNRPRSPECPHECLSRRLPPPEPALVSFHPTHLIEHPNEGGVASFNPSLDERPSALHGPVEEFDQRVASLGVESVGVSDEPKAGGKIQVPKPEATGAEVIVDGHAHPSEGCEVKERPSCWNQSITTDWPTTPPGVPLTSLDHWYQSHLPPGQPWHGWKSCIPLARGGTGISRNWKQPSSDLLLATMQEGDRTDPLTILIYFDKTGAGSPNFYRDSSGLCGSFVAVGGSQGRPEADAVDP